MADRIRAWWFGMKATELTLGPVRAKTSGTVREGARLSRCVCLPGLPPGLLGLFGFHASSLLTILTTVL
jgi:hypothetical protein